MEIIITSDRLDIHKRGRIVDINNNRSFPIEVQVNGLDLRVRLRADEVIRPQA